jgi:hypothetical protein
MKRKLLMIGAASLAGACALNAADGDLLAEDATGATFDVYSADSATYAAKSAAEIAALPRVTYRAGETVTAAKWNGGETSLVASAASDGSTAFAPDAGGVWILNNSAQGTARICVPWSVYGDTMSLASPVYSEYAVDSALPGPNRSSCRKKALPISYTGDNWIGDIAKAATLKLTAPSGAETTLNLSGSGATQFSFTEAGDWTVQLTMENGDTRTAVLTLNEVGLLLIVR